MIALAAGAASGLIFIAPTSGAVIGLIIVNLTHLPLFLVGLGLGLPAVAIASVSATALVGLVVGFWDVITFVVAFALPTLVVIRQSLLMRTATDGTAEWYPPGHLLSIIVIYGATAFVVARIVLATQLERLEQFAGARFDMVFAHYFPDLAEVHRTALVADLIAALPVMMVMSWVLTIAANAVFAQYILVRSGTNQRPTPRYSRFETPRALALGVAGGAVLWFAASDMLGNVGRTVAIILSTPYFFQGLAVIHELSRTWVARLFALMIFYALLLFVLGWPGFLFIAGLGFVEQWVGLRRRFAGTGSGKEED